MHPAVAEVLAFHDLGKQQFYIAVCLNFIVAVDNIHCLSPPTNCFLRHFVGFGGENNRREIKKHPSSNREVLGIVDSTTINVLRTVKLYGFF